MNVTHHDPESSYPLPVGGDAADVAGVLVKVVLAEAGLYGLHAFDLVVAGPLHHHGVVTEGADEGASVLSKSLRTVFRHVILHEGEIRSLLALRSRIQHARETQLGV